MSVGFPASSLRTEKFEIEPIILRQLVSESIEKLGWPYETVDDGIFVAKIPMGESSYGERLTASVQDDGTLTVRSVCGWPLQFFDWGKNKRNINQLFLALISTARNFALNPLEIPSGFDREGTTPIERALFDKK